MVLAARVRKRERAHPLDVEGAPVAVKVLYKRQYRADEPVCLSLFSLVLVNG